MDRIGGIARSNGVPTHSVLVGKYTTFLANVCNHFYLHFAFCICRQRDRQLELWTCGQDVDLYVVAHHIDVIVEDK